jgi:hypothetical protein
MTTKPDNAKAPTEANPPMVSNLDLIPAEALEAPKEAPKEETQDGTKTPADEAMETLKEEQQDDPKARTQAWETPKEETQDDTKTPLDTKKSVPYYVLIIFLCPIWSISLCILWSKPLVSIINESRLVELCESSALLCVLCDENEDLRGQYEDICAGARDARLLDLCGQNEDICAGARDAELLRASLPEAKSQVASALLRDENEDLRGNNEDLRAGAGDAAAASLFPTPSVGFYFGSKEQLLLELLRPILPEAKSQVASALLRDENEDLRGHNEGLRAGAGDAAAASLSPTPSVGFYFGSTDQLLLELLFVCVFVFGIYILQMTL